MMPQNRDRNGRPRSNRPYDQNRDTLRPAAPSQNTMPRTTGGSNSRCGYNGEPLSRPPSRSANGSVRTSRADNSIQFPTQPQTRRPPQGRPDNTTLYPAGTRSRTGTARPAGNAPANGGRKRRPANGSAPRSRQQHPASSGQAAPHRQSQRLRPAQPAGQARPARREMRKKRKVTRATLRRRRMMRRLMAFAMLLCVIGAGVYLTMTMLFRIGTIQVQNPDGTPVTEVAGYTADSILQQLGVRLEENIFSFDPAEKAAQLEQAFPLLESIRVVRDYPSTVVVQVTEAVPTYAVQSGSKWFTVSAGWKLLSEDSAQPEGLCTLYGGELQNTLPGQQLLFADSSKADAGSDASASASVAEAQAPCMEALYTLRTKLDEYGLLQDVTRLEFADTEQLAFLYQDRISVLLGTLNDLDYKLDRARYVLTNADGKGCGPTDTGRLDFSHTSASSTRKIYFAQGDPTLPSGYVVPQKPADTTAGEAADSTASAESTEPAEAAEPAEATDTTDPTDAAADAETGLPLTDPARMTANEDEHPM